MNEKTPMLLLSESWEEKLAADREAKRKLLLQKRTGKVEAGQKYGRLTAIRHDRKGRWIFRCECGVEKSFRIYMVTEGKSFSCGCYLRDVRRFNNRTHGATSGTGPTKEYRAWESMKRRCLVSTDAKYPIYGGRGIKVCARWISSFINFHADMGDCPAGLTLERIDVNGNYEPNNCTWASPEKQANNRRCNVRIEFGGQIMTRAEWARFLGIGYEKLATLLSKGLPISDVQEALEVARKRVL